MSSNTEFLIFGQPQQLSKLNTPTTHLPNNVIPSPVDSARNLGVVFHKNVSLAQHIYSISKSCFLNIRDLRRRLFVILLIKLLPAPLLLLAFIIKLTIVTLFYSIYLLHKRIVFNLSLTLLLVLSPKLLNFITITPILKSLHWLKINERIKYKVLSLSHINLSKLVNLLTYALFFQRCN